MPTTIIKISHSGDSLYEAFRRFSHGHPQGSFFQGEAFLRFGEYWPEGEVVAFVLSDGDEVKASLVAATIRERMGMLGRFTARTIVYGGPLLAEGSAAEREAWLFELLIELIKYSRSRALFIQFRNFFDWSGFEKVFRELGFDFHERLNLLVDASDEKSTWNNLSASRRRQVRLSVKNGAGVVERPTVGQVDEFYAILRRLYKTRVRKPLPSRAFFQAFRELSDDGAGGGADAGCIAGVGPAVETDVMGSGGPRSGASGVGPAGGFLLVTYRDRVIGGIVCPTLPERAVYEWYVGGLDQEFRGKGIYPSVLATWAGIQFAARTGAPVFDFMGMGKPDEPYGVRDFKARFGGRWVNYGRFSRVNRPLLYFFAEIGYNLKRTLQKRI